MKDMRPLEIEARNVLVLAKEILGWMVKRGIMNSGEYNEVISSAAEKIDKRYSDNMENARQFLYHCEEAAKFEGLIGYEDEQDLGTSLTSCIKKLKEKYGDNNAQI